MSEIWINHLSIEAWQEPDCWTSYFEQAQKILGAQLTHLGIADPIRKKVISLDAAGEYVCAFKAREDSRWLFGKIDAIGAEISIQHYRQLGHWPNSLSWHLPLSFINKAENRARLKALFDLGNKSFKPFYSYSDDVSRIICKKKSSGAVDIRAELLGIFWMTYFNAAYAEFFGRSKFNDFPRFEYDDDDGGVTVLLGDSPHSVPDGLREQLVRMLGEHSFVNVHDLLGKQPGRFALTFQQLRAFQNRERGDAGN